MLNRQDSSSLLWKKMENNENWKHLEKGSFERLLLCSKTYLKNQQYNKIWDKHIRLKKQMRGVESICQNMYLMRNITLVHLTSTLCVIPYGLFWEQNIVKILEKLRVLIVVFKSELEEISVCVSDWDERYKFYLETSTHAMKFTKFVFKTTPK